MRGEHNASTSYPLRCAGNTLPRRLPAPSAWDHPRMRGEHLVALQFRQRQLGSSPHARGTPSCADHEIPWSGIIPACAGNTIIFVFRLVIIGDHPRMRGEHNSSDLKTVGDTGSSPHARGTLKTCCGVPSARGIIPACAGNTVREFEAFIVLGDHPRMRGEHLYFEYLCLLLSGSSPHARGTQDVSHRYINLLRIIPACAGNTMPIILPQ